MTRRGMVREVVYESVACSSEGRLEDFIGFLEDISKKTPEEYRGSLRIDFVETCEYDTQIAIMVYYERPETIEELAARYEGIGKINARRTKGAK